jgi:hypothetical protein
MVRPVDPALSLFNLVRNRESYSLIPTSFCRLQFVELQGRMSLETIVEYIASVHLTLLNSI